MTTTTGSTPEPVPAEPGAGIGRWGRRLYLAGALVYLAAVAVALVVGHPTGRAVGWTLAWATIVLAAGGAALLLLRRHKATRARRAADAAGARD